MAPTCNIRLISLFAALASAHHHVHVSLALSAGRFHSTTNIPCGRSFARSDFSLRGSPTDDECTNRISANESNGADLPRRRFVSSLVSKAFVATPLLSLIAAPQRSNAAYRDPKTGILLPSVGEIESSLPTTWDEDDNPVTSRDKSAFARLDSAPDSAFYTDPKFVEHVDEAAVESMTSYVSDVLIKPGDSVLDLCSSWTSHIRQGTESKSLKRVAGLGMNAKELESNKALTEWTVMDLNADANVKLPYDDESFDVIMLQLSIDYLIHPLEVMKEASRVLKKNGKIAILFSNRLFLSKAVGLWTGSDDVEHAYTVGGYLRFCGGGYENIVAEDLSTRKKKGKERPIVGDPLYVVTATKGG